MTLGGVRHDVRDVTRNLGSLEKRITAIETAQAHADRRFVRLLIWLGLVTFVAGASVILAFVFR